MRIVHLLKLGARHHPVGVLQPDLPGNGRRCSGMIAGNHLHADARANTFGDRGHGLGARRVDQSDKADQLHPPFKVGAVEHDMGLRNRACGKGQHALPLRRQQVDLFKPVSLVERRRLAVVRSPALAHFQDTFRRAFGVNERIAFVIVMQHGHIAVPGIERDAVGS